MDTMDLFVTLGLRDAGYVYVGVDDCWASSRDPSTGVIQADPVSFPSGMAALASYAHARSLKFGLYSSNSPKTCDQRPGSYGYEVLDAQTYVSSDERCGGRCRRVCAARGRERGAVRGALRYFTAFSPSSHPLHSPYSPHGVLVRKAILSFLSPCFSVLSSMSSPASVLPASPFPPPPQTC